MCDGDVANLGDIHTHTHVYMYIYIYAVTYTRGGYMLHTGMHFKGCTALHVCMYG